MTMARTRGRQGTMLGQRDRSAVMPAHAGIHVLLFSEGRERYSAAVSSPMGQETPVPPSPQ